MVLNRMSSFDSCSTAKELLVPVRGSVCRDMSPQNYPSRYFTVQKAFKFFNNEYISESVLRLIINKILSSLTLLLFLFREQ